MLPPRCVCLTGATGYIGSRLAASLIGRGHQVRALARKGSEQRLPAGCVPILGDALDHRTYAARVAPADTFVHLVGVANPGPAKAEQFRTAPVMKAYTAARADAEALIGRSCLAATILRPWYVLGPGHRWPVLLLPLYWLGALVPLTREGARRLGLVTLAQMLRALVWAVEHPATSVSVLEVPDVRRGALDPA